MTDLLPSGDTSGATDLANVSALLKSGCTSVQLGPGKFYANSPVNLLYGGQSVKGSGNKATSWLVTSTFSGDKPSPAFTAPGAFQLWRTGGYISGCQVSDMFIGAVSGSAPLASAVNIYGVDCNVLANIQAQLNGWAVLSIAGASANVGTRINGLQSSGGAGGIHVKGPGVMEHFLSDINIQQTGTGSGPAANLDCILVEDAEDILLQNFNGAISDVCTGSTLHVKGATSTFYAMNLDIGCYPNGAGSNAVILIEDSPNGSPSDVRITQGVAQQGKNALVVNGGASRLRFTDYRFFNNSGTAVRLLGTGNDIRFRACDWLANGPGKPNFYDLEVTGTAGGSADSACQYGMAQPTHITSPNFTVN